MPARSQQIALLVIAGCLGVAAWMSLRTGRPSKSASPRGTLQNSALQSQKQAIADLSAIEAAEAHAAETVWTKEMQAQACGRAVEEFWDRLNRATNKLEMAAVVSFEKLVLPAFQMGRQLPHGIDILTSTQPGASLARLDWENLVREAIAKDWVLEQCEFRHIRFDPDGERRAASSAFYFSAHLANSSFKERAAIEGEIEIQWGPSEHADELRPIRKVDASRLNLKRRRGDPFFRKVLEEQITPRGDNHWSDPMLVYDLDRDGFPEIFFAGRNLVFRRTSDGRYTREALLKKPLPFVSSALFGDFDGDGEVDLLCARFEGLFLFAGSKNGRFEQVARLAAKPAIAMRQAIAMTAGDIDGDGDLDVFIAQYKEPYEDGKTPKPFFDANDGEPAYLFLNDGMGNFRDATEERGLARNRFRRSYSASFVDLDADQHLDLMAVSDFAGLDLYQNNGAGHFTEITSDWAPERYGFGMGHALNDFNRDGILDLLMIGMTSPTVQRLDHLGLYRAGLEGERDIRSRMTFGNRLYCGRRGGGFETSASSGSVANSGWSWGSAAEDFDNDGYPDVYVANGLESNSSVRDYEPEYWLHDQYVESPAAALYFQGKMSRTRSRDYSYAGYEKNRLYLNEGAKSFAEVGWLGGVALEADCRNVVGADMNRDGKVDLVVSTLEIWPEARQRIFVFQNELPLSGNWIGFTLPSAGATEISIRTGDRKAVRAIVTGDSYRSQSPKVVHFGLGDEEKVDEVVICLKKSERRILRSPMINRYNVID